MKFLRLFFFLALALAASPALARDPWPAQGFGENWGVQVKEARTTSEELDKIKAAGLSSVRFVIPWYEVEKGKGSFVWGYFDDFIARLRERGLKAVIVIGAGHPSYTRKIKAPEGNMDQADYYLAAPTTPEEIAAFANYAAQTVLHFGGDDIVWEIWNEPDSDRFWAPKAKAEDYVKVALAACRAMRAAAPQAKIVGPGMADTPGRYGTLFSGFLGKVLRSDLSDCFDGVSVHPYRDGEKPPETVLEAYRKLRAFIKAFTPEGRTPLPVLATEWGFTLTDTSEEEQAAFLLRTFLLNELAGVKLSIWYEWRDAREGEDDAEAHFGLLDLREKEKASYKALAAFLPALRGAKIEERIEGKHEEDFALRLLRPDGKRFVVFWSCNTHTNTRLKIAEGQGEKLFALTPLPQALEISPAVRLSLEVTP